MVTHEHDLVQYFGGRIINLKNGQVVFDDFIGGKNTEDDDDEEG
jgi:cell division transport system ATP-binding protein